MDHSGQKAFSQVRNEWKLAVKHRTEIDGLRALAVLPVILYHAGLPGIDGGFLGVDVFFVISGFLITTILLKDLENGRFSLWTFYERRARRILPALFFVILVCLPFAWIWMFPKELRDFGQSIVATSFFISNVLFWKETNYFNASSELKPLLHTWSLAVEEQFYIFFPLMLAGVWKWKPKLVLPMIMTIALGSFVLAESFVVSHEEATFYLLHARAWELMIGSICAVLIIKAPPQGSGWLGLLGLALILGSYLLLDDKNPMPSAWSLPVVLGTGFVLIFAKADNVAGRMLSFRPFVWIGLISYSAYLWHQPVLAFARIRATVEPSWPIMTGLVLLSLVLATFTWRYIEQPFRSSKGQGALLLPRRGPLLTGAASGMVVVSAFGMALHIADGAPSRIAPRTLQILEAVKDRNPRRDICHQPAHAVSDLIIPPPPDCITQAAATKGSAIIIGDSHADAIAYSVRSMLESEGWHITELTVTACTAYLGYDRKVRACDQINERIYAYIESLEVDLIVTAARSQELFDPSPFDNGVGGIESGKGAPPFTLHKKKFGLQETATREEFLRASFITSTNRLADMSRAIVTIDPIPEAGWDVPVWMARNSLGQNQVMEDLATPRYRYKERAGKAQDIFREIDRDDVILVDTESIFCHDDVCDNARGGELFYYDDDHLSLKGAQLVADKIQDELPRIEALIETAVANLPD
jgi:peptidoglycan/LPS O-acetylase OafA/YrhL